MYNKETSKREFSLIMEDELLEQPIKGKKMSYKTIEKRIDDIIKTFNIDVKSLKNAKGHMYFKKAEQVVLNLFIKDYINKGSLVYKMIVDPTKDIEFSEIKNFMDNIPHILKGKIDDELEVIMYYFDECLGYSALVEMENIYVLLEALSANFNTKTYTYNLNCMQALRRLLEKELTRETIETVQYLQELLELISLRSELYGFEKHNYDDIEDTQLKTEYEKRDTEALVYLKENPLIKQHIEEKLKKSITDVFN